MRRLPGSPKKVWNLIGSFLKEPIPDKKRNYQTKKYQFGLANARRNLMKFLFLGVMSDESVSNMHTTSFDKRKAMADVVANGAGGSLIDMCFVQGIYDMVAIMDLPSNSAAIGAKAAVLAAPKPPPSPVAGAACIPLDGSAFTAASPTNLSKPPGSVNMFPSPLPA